MKTNWDLTLKKNLVSYLSGVFLLGVLTNGMCHQTRGAGGEPGSPSVAAKKYANLEEALQAEAPGILAQLRKNPAYKNIGVLKFQVQLGEDRPHDNVGPLNLRMADRLEIALIMALKQPGNLRLLKNASAAVVESKNRRANHLTDSGRRAFFDIKSYVPAWGSPEERLAADVLLTGLVRLDKDYETLCVSLEAFDRTGQIKPISSFRADTDTRVLADAGISFAVSRDAFNPQRRPRAKAQLTEPVQQEAPIDFEVLFDGKPVTAKNGLLAEPQAGQKVGFRLRHKGKDAKTYGVVLKVNGQSSVFPEFGETDDLTCWKWILAPGTTIDVEGFQRTDKKANQFEAASVYQSLPSEVRYNPHVGTFSIVIFRAKENDKDTDPVVQKELKNPTLAAISRGILARGEAPVTLKALQGQLRKSPGRDESDLGGRGVIVEGKDFENQVTKVPFKPFEQPVYSVTIRYFHPENK